MDNIDELEKLEFLGDNGLTGTVFQQSKMGMTMRQIEAEIWDSLRMR